MRKTHTAGHTAGHARAQGGNLSKMMRETTEPTQARATPRSMCSETLSQTYYNVLRESMMHERLLKNGIPASTKQHITKDMFAMTPFASTKRHIARGGKLKMNLRELWLCCGDMRVVHMAVLPLRNVTLRTNVWKIHHFASTKPPIAQNAAETA